jgi:integrase
MAISRHHAAGCLGDGCGCPWRLDFRPAGVAGPRKRIEFPTKKAAEKYLTAVAHKVSRGEYIAPALVPTFGTVGAEWLASKRDHHPASQHNWRTHIRHLSALNDAKLDRINVAMIERLRDDLRQSLSALTVAGIMTTLAAIFKFALRRGYATTNPAALAERPRQAVAALAGDDDAPSSSGGLRKVRLDEVLGSDEIRRLLDAADPGLYRTLFSTVAATGLRSEEALALRWGDLELGAERPRLFVRRSLSRSRANGESGPIKAKFYQPKTKSSRRELPLPGALAAMLKVWKLQCPPSRHDLVFCQADGEPLHRATVLNRLYPSLRRAGLRQINIKTLRHSFASGLIAMGAPITEVASRLGHSDPSVTLKIYSHWFRDTDTGSADRFAAGFLSTSVPTLGNTDVISEHTKPRKMLRK